jgi:molybdopterin converting factor subunit 1
MSQKIQVRVMFFAAATDVVGKRAFQISVPRNSKSRDLFDQILSQFPELKKYRLLFAVNQEYAKGNEILKEGDEVGIFTPVSGG